MKIVTDNKDFAKYLMGKFVNVYLADRADVNPDALYIMFNGCRNSSVCGNRFNKERLNNGTMERDFMHNLEFFKCKHLILVTPVTNFGGKIMEREYPLLQELYNTYIDNSLVVKQNIHSSQLGELSLPRRLQIYYRGVKQLQPITNKIVSPPMVYMNGKNQRKLDYDVINATRDKDKRHKMRYFPEYALYSEIYNQIVKEGVN